MASDLRTDTHFHEQLEHPAVCALLARVGDQPLGELTRGSVKNAKCRGRGNLVAKASVRTAIPRALGVQFTSMSLRNPKNLAS